MKINVYDKLYHSIGYWDTSTKEKLESILQNQYIYTREDMKNILGTNLANKYIVTDKENNHNGIDYVSLTRKPRINLFSKLHDCESNSFLKYVLMYYKISLIINKKILKDMEYRKYGLAYETQVKGSIPISYIDAIGVSIEDTRPLLEDLKANKGIEADFFDSYDVTLLKELKQLILQYNFNVPIIDSDTGKVYLNKYKF